MIACFDPEATYADAKAAIECQRDNGRAASCGQANDFVTAECPCEVFLPHLCARIEKKRADSCKRVSRFDQGTFRLVAETA